MKAFLWTFNSFVPELKSIGLSLRNHGNNSRQKLRHFKVVIIFFCSFMDLMLSRLFFPDESLPLI